MKIFFEYHCWESPKSADAILWQHSKQFVTIVRPLTADECDIEEIGQMYKVRFDDGLEYDIFEDELFFDITK